MNKVKKILIILMSVVFTTLCLLTSCDQNEDIESNIIGTKLTIYVGGTEIDGDALENDTVLVDLDTMNTASNIKILAYHILSGGYYSKKAFTFKVSPNIKIYETTDTSILILTSQVFDLGQYVITVESSVNEKYNRQFILDLASSSIKKLNLTYEIKDEQRALLEEIEGIDETLLSGKIDDDNTGVVWVQGGIYTLKATDIDTNSKANSIYVYSTDDTKAYVRGNERVVLVANEGETVSIEAVVGYTQVKRKFTVEAKRYGNINVENYIPISEEEQCISLKKGESETFKLTYTGIEKSELLYSIDGENIYQDDYYNNAYKNYIPEVNTEAHWNEMNRLAVEDDYMWNEKDEHTSEKVLFEIIVDNTTNLFTITAKDSSTYITKTDSTERNLHKYLYIKTKADTQWRWKIRILVDGVLEGIEFYNLEGSDNKEVYIGDTLEMTEDNSRSNLLRVKFIPETYEDDEIWFFLADPKKTREYTVSGKKVVIPCPVGDEKGKVDEALFNVISFTSNNGSATIGGGDLKIKKGVHYEKSGTGNVDISTNYNNTGDDVKLVAINPNSGVWTSVLFKCKIDNAMVIKSIKATGNTNMFSFVKTRINMNKYVRVKQEEDSSNLTYMSTLYDGKSTEQAYPNTVVKTPKERTFFIQANGELEIEATTTFDIKDMTMTVDANATKVLGGAVVEVSQTNPKKAIITVNTVWSAISKKDKEAYDDKEAIQMFMTTEEGVLTYLNVSNGNKTYLVPIRFIVFYDTKASL